MVTRRALFKFLGLFQQTQLSDQQVSLSKVVIRGTGPTRFYLSAGPAPADTVSDGVTFDAVLYVDADNIMKVLLKDGTVKPLWS